MADLFSLGNENQGDIPSIMQLPTGLRTSIRMPTHKPELLHGAFYLQQDWGQMRSISPYLLKPASISPYLFDANKITPTWVDPTLIDAEDISAKQLDPNLFNPGHIDPTLINPNFYKGQLTNPYLSN